LYFSDLFDESQSFKSLVCISQERATMKFQLQYEGTDASRLVESVQARESQLSAAVALLAEERDMFRFVFIASVFHHISPTIFQFGLVVFQPRNGGPTGKMVSRA
jgi:hypothetical protein